MTGLRLFKMLRKLILRNKNIDDSIAENQYKI